MTRVTFETAAIADAIKKADRVAPGSGEAFDKAAGILIVISDELTIKATNLDLYSTQWVDPIKFEGDHTAWRLPSKLLNMVMASLPIGTGQEVVMWDEQVGQHYQVHLQSGRTKARFYQLNVDHFPNWAPFNPDTLSPVADVGGRLAQVEWAAAKSEPPFSGVNFDGEYAIATDRYRLARVPLAIPGIEPGESITAPSSILASLLAQTGEVAVGVDGSQLLVMPDDHTQYRAILFGQKYPSLKRVMDTKMPDSLTIRKQHLLDIMARAVTFSGADRFPCIHCFIGKEEFAVMMNNDEMGRLGDVLEIPGQAFHDRLAIKFTPKNIIEPIERAPSEEITIFYDSSNSLSMFKIDGGSAYEAWAMPRAKESGE